MSTPEEMVRRQKLEAIEHGWETDAEQRLDGALALLGILGLTLMLIGAGAVVWGAWRAYGLWRALG